MAALVEYPEAKSILEDHAKKRMKTNLQAQRSFNVDALLRNSQENSSVDSGIVTKEEEKGQEVSEIKAMIEDLKNASRVPGRTIWQLIARCEVLQSKLLDKEKEVEDSKHRIKDLEQLLFSHHYSKHDEEDSIDCTSGESPENSPIKSLRPNNNNNRVVKQFSQDEGRTIQRESSGSPLDNEEATENQTIPDLKITRPSSESSSEESERKYSLDSNTFIKTSKIHNIYEKNVASKKEETPRDASSEKDLSTIESSRGTDCFTNFKICTQNIWDWKSCSNYCFSNETLIDQEIFLSNEEGLSLSTRVKDQFSLSDSYPLSVSTIPEENEEDSGDTTGNGEASVTKAPSTLDSDNKTESKYNTLATNVEDQHELNQNTKCLDQLENEEDMDRINYRRLRLLSDCFLNDPNSRRNSWNNSDSEGYSDDDDEITSS